MAATTTPALIVAEFPVSQDAEGRFSLNDLHRAAGGEDRHRPSRWTENQQSKELIEELSKAGIPALETVHGGANAGTYVARELVYAYAMWISARFHLQVIRAYDELLTGGRRPAGADELTVPQAMALQRQAGRLLQLIPDARSDAARQLLHGHLAQAQRMLGEPTPALADLLVASAATGQDCLPGIPAA